MRTYTVLLQRILTAVAVVALSGCGSTNPISPSAPIAAAPVPAPQGPFTVTGVVTELVGNGPVAVAGAHVEDSQRHFVVQTGEDGSYRIEDVEAFQGQIYLYFAKDGYQSTTRTFAPGANEVRVDILLVRE
jgi:hypothetical protein